MVTGVDWRIQQRNLFRVFHPTEDNLSTLRSYILLETSEDGCAVDTMRVAVHGEQPLVVRFKGAAIFTASELADYQFCYQILPATIQTRDNMVTTDWRDIREAVSNQVIKVEGPDGKESAEEFKFVLDTVQAADYQQGAVFRWAIHAATPTSLSLVLQGLPASLIHIKTKGQFKMDNCPAIAIATFDLASQFQGGGGVAGPVPVLFSTDPKTTEAKLQQNPSAAFAGNKRDSTEMQMSGWQK